MFDKISLFKQAMMRADIVMLGDKRAKIEKITPKKWKELFAVVGSLPALIRGVIAAPEEDLAAYILSAVEVGLDDVLHVVEALTGIEYEYLNEHVGLTEIIEYLVQMAHYNNLERAVKNVLSLLPKAE